MRILLAGIVGRYPFGGVAWCSRMYLAGLQALGHELCYVEDTGECVYDPVQNTLADDPGYGTAYIENTLAPLGLGERWSYVNHDGTYHGMSRAALTRYCESADLFINLSGGSWFWRDEYLGIPKKVFIDSDPVFTQLAIAKGVPWYVDFFRQFDRLFTFGANIGREGCDVPTGEFDWTHTWQPVTVDDWRTSTPAARTRFTTVMTWRTESFTDVDGNKDREFVQFIDLPARAPDRFALAVNGPLPLLADHGWAPIPAMEVSRTPEAYREFIRGSWAEFGVAKHAYVRYRSGWFSDRTECYLAAGRPALVQDTGWSAHVPAGTGLLAFTTAEDAAAGIEALDADYARHAAHAVEIARETFAADRVLPSLLDRACV